MSSESSNVQSTFILGIAGDSGSGKTTVVDSVTTELGDDVVNVLPHDAYYRSKPHLDFEERSKSNFDHPDSLETELMSEHLKQLILGENIPLPIYDFSSHLRSKKSKTIHPRPILIIDGILVLHEKMLGKEWI